MRSLARLGLEPMYTSQEKQYGIGRSQINGGNAPMTFGVCGRKPPLPPCFLRLCPFLLVGDSGWPLVFDSNWNALELIVDPELKQQTIGLATRWHNLYQTAWILAAYSFSCFNATSIGILRFHMKERHGLYECRLTNCAVLSVITELY